MKFGGSSVATVEKLLDVADKVVRARRRGHGVVVVVSAMGKTTDELVALARKVAPDPPRRELDMLVSTGERVSMALLSIAISARGEDAISFTGSQSGIITNDRHFDARIIEVRPHRIEDELARGRIVIVAGYQGMSYKREITTLGRGGSDTTAVALAAALGAERCEIYSDVDGVYSADPRVVPEAVHLPEIDLAAVQEMAEAGAKVLNAQAVEWARRAKIAIYARRTADPEDERGGVARETVAREGAVVRARAVVGLKGVVAARFPRALLPEFVARDLPLVDLAMTGDVATGHIPLLNVPDWSERRRGLARPGVVLEEGRGIVSVVGDDLMPGGASRLEDTLRTANIPCAAVFAGPLRVAGVVAESDVDRAQRALHDALVRDRPAPQSP